MGKRLPRRRGGSPKVAARTYTYCFVHVNDVRATTLFLGVSNVVCLTHTYWFVHCRHTLGTVPCLAEAHIHSALGGAM